MYVTDKAEIVIDASSEDIWEYVTDPRPLDGVEPRGTLWARIRHAR